MRVLVVEDEAALREGLVDLLVAAGYQVESTADGLQAVELGTDPHVDMVLLDLMLPGLDGLEVCRQLRAVRPAMPIVMLTARGAEVDKVAGLRSGADDYVCKPFGTRELLARVAAQARRLQAVPAAPRSSRWTAAPSTWAGSPSPVTISSTS